MRHIFYLLPGLVALSLWEVVVWGDRRLTFLFASPSAVLAVAWEELRTVTMWVHIGITTMEALLGLVIGASVGALCGLLLWADERVAKVAYPYVVLIGAIPIFAIAPMLIIWFGTGLASKVVMAGFAVFFVSLSQTYEGARYCDQEYVNYARTLRASRRRIVRTIIIPGALRWVTSGLKMSVGLALVGAFIGEFVSSDRGLGHFILAAGSLYDTPRVLFGVGLIAAVALVITAAVWSFERWKPHLFAK